MIKRDLINPLTKEDESSYSYSFGNFKDRNGNGTGEITITNRDSLDITLQINGWSLAQGSQMYYDWGSTSINLVVTDPMGVEEVIKTNSGCGSQSSYFHERAFWVTLSVFKELSSYKNWEHRSLVKEINTLKQNLAQLEAKLIGFQ